MAGVKRLRAFLGGLHARHRSLEALAGLAAIGWGLSATLGLAWGMTVIGVLLILDATLDPGSPRRPRSPGK